MIKDNKVVDTNLSANFENISKNLVRVYKKTSAKFIILIIICLILFPESWQRSTKRQCVNQQLTRITINMNRQLIRILTLSR